MIWKKTHKIFKLQYALLYMLTNSPCLNSISLILRKNPLIDQDPKEHLIVERSQSTCTKPSPLKNESIFSTPASPTPNRNFFPTILPSFFQLHPTIEDIVSLPPWSAPTAFAGKHESPRSKIINYYYFNCAASTVLPRV